MANVFIHFEPLGALDGEIEYDGDLPPYVIPGSPEEPEWRAKNPEGHQIVGGRQFTTGSTEAHRLAGEKTTKIEELAAFLDKHEEAVTHRDVNGWTPLAEAVRAGNEPLVRLLLDRGSEANHRVGEEGAGPSILYLAKEHLDQDDPIIALLIDRGAREIPPDSHSEL